MTQAQARPPDINQVRRHVKTVVTLIKRDEGFARRAQENPRHALAEAGLDEGAIEDFLREEGFTAEGFHEQAAGGAARPALPCRWTCLCTACCISGRCWITV